ncbi:hypothetical protein QQ020_07605 [Fulvivirgaceae bacterium BMA12]|uniref:Histidine kinase n=1 Tax=Agaribacillus aureus TaxID=3051825 RepID=A0ABT8L641_9BACT|nr:hypothetical protein [Fulvivirgaceae bacterium BMA12]
MKLKTIKLLLISIVIIVPILLIATFWQSMGLSNENTIFLALALIVAFGFNTIGVILGIKEREKDHKKATIGILANATLIVLFLILVISSF